MDKTIENFKALHEFADNAGLGRGNSGRVKFDAYATIDMGGNDGSGVVTARISFVNGDGTQLDLDAGDSFISGSHPLGYNADYGTWTFEDGALVIEGDYKGKAYRTEVRVNV